MREPGYEISADVFFSSYIWSRFAVPDVSIGLPSRHSYLAIFIGKQEQGWMHK